MSNFYFIFTIVTIIIVVASTNLGFYYYYKLYKLTQYSEVWKSFKGITIGVIGGFIGGLVMLTMVFDYLLTTFPDLFADAYFNITNFFALAVILGAPVSATGVAISIYGARNFYKNMEKLVIETAKSTESVES